MSPLGTQGCAHKFSHQLHKPALLGLTSGPCESPASLRDYLDHKTFIHKTLLRLPSRSAPAFVSPDILRSLLRCIAPFPVCCREVRGLFSTSQSEPGNEKRQEKNSVNYFQTVQITISAKESSKLLFCSFCCCLKDSEQAIPTLLSA